MTLHQTILAASSHTSHIEETTLEPPARNGQQQKLQRV